MSIKTSERTMLEMPHMAGLWTAETDELLHVRGRLISAAVAIAMSSSD